MRKLIYYIQYKFWNLAMDDTKSSLNYRFYRFKFYRAKRKYKESKWI